MNKKEAVHPLLLIYLQVLLSRILGIITFFVKSPLYIAIMILSYTIFLLYLVNNFKRFKNEESLGDRIERDQKMLYILLIGVWLYQVIIDILKFKN